MVPETILGGLAFPEAPRWHDGALYFSDMHTGTVWRLTSEGTATQVTVVANSPSGLGWFPDGSLAVVSMLDRLLLRVETHATTTIADLSSLTPFPINDMVIAGSRAYIGSFGFDLIKGESPRPASLFCVEENGAIRTVAEDLLFPNGMVITPDGKNLIVAETFGARLTAFDLQPDGSLANRRVFAHLEGISPDGICLDQDRCIWVACPNGNQIIRVKEGGEIMDTVPLPGRRSYACMLGGADRRDLYICTAHDFRPEKTLPACAGKIEVMRVEVHGAPEALVE